MPPADTEGVLLPSRSYAGSVVAGERQLPAAAAEPPLKPSCDGTLRSLLTGDELRQAMVMRQARISKHNARLAIRSGRAQIQTPSLWLPACVQVEALLRHSTGAEDGSSRQQLIAQEAASLVGTLFGGERSCRVWTCICHHGHIRFTLFVLRAGFQPHDPWRYSARKADLTAGIVARAKTNLLAGKREYSYKGQRAQQLARER